MFEEAQKTLSDRIEAIKAKYAPQIKALQDDGKRLEDETKRPSDIGGIIGIDFRVDWKDEDIIFDVPRVTMRDQGFSLDLPEIGSARQHIAFDVPDVRMVDREVGKYPEVHFPSVVWKPIIITVPEPYMRRQDIYYDLPTVTMKRQDFVIGIPEFRMERVRWVLKLPQFTVVNVHAQIDRAKEEGESLKTKSQALAANMRSEIEHEVALFKQQVANGANGTKQQISNSFDGALGQIGKAISDLQAQRCDPVKVPTDGGNINLRKMFSDVTDAKTSALAKFGDAAAPAATL